MAVSQALRLLLTCMMLAGSTAVRIKGDGQKVLYLPKGESVNLGCPFASDPEDNTPDNDWDIEWKRTVPGQHPQDNPLLGYHDHQVIYPGSPDLQQRVGFTSADPSLYDASMQLRDVQVTDSATYECTVKKTTEAKHKVTITVQERPAVPQCTIIGDIAYGQDITLRCFTSVGSPPLSYRWSMMHGEQFRDWLPPGGSAGSVPGDLHIYDLCEDHVGTYQCAVGNNVGVSYCTVDVYLGGGVSYGWIIGGSVVIALLATALIVGGVIWCCLCCCGRAYCSGCCGAGQCPGCYCGKDHCWDCCCSCCEQRPKQECIEVKPSEICVDAEAPPSRPCSQAYSRASSLHSLLGYQTRSAQYTQGRKTAPAIVQVKMTPPPDSGTDVAISPEFPSPPSSESGEVSEPYYGAKGRGLYSPSSSEARYVKGEDHEGLSARPQVFPESPGYTTPTAELSDMQWKGGNGRHYKGGVVMMRSSSKEGLLI
ncbi:V-set and immunoglobulin domain-containing protein 8-like [Varanus komodoensis]|uniref:V-set and immunoglobulin domain-containing protein 8-like n=1 Tax=Varanus komodoensis TaxID=61221 RepID=UPI001CF76B37|nr:V-set and immunoglobulin domain-containing protein 8-like [Varanus komodoensis]